MATPLNPETRDKLMIEYGDRATQERQETAQPQPVPLHPATRDHLYARLMNR